MINRTIVFAIVVSFLNVTSASNPINRNQISELESSRQSPESPYFDAVVYPHAWSWALTALVFVVFKSFGLFVAFAMWAYWEQRIRGKPTIGRAGLDDWMDFAVRYLASGQSEYCRKQLVCEVNEYTRKVPLMGRIELDGVWSKSEEECANFDERRSGSCSLTIGDFFLRKNEWNSEKDGTKDISS